MDAGDRYAIAIWFYDSPRSRSLGLAPWVLGAAEDGNVSQASSPWSLRSLGRCAASVATLL